MEIVPEIVPLWKHQREGMLRALQLGSFAWLYEMGAGKTLTAITTLRNLCHRHGRMLRVLILCPSAVVENWRIEMGKFSKFGPHTTCLVGSRKDRILQLGHPGKSIFVTNYEALDMEGLFWELKGKRKVPVQHNWDVIICDESHRLKNPHAKRTKLAHIVRDLPSVQHVFLMTGTPILNHPEDVWSQWRMMDGGQTFGRHFMDFRNRYFWNENANKPSFVTWPSWVPKPGALEQLRELMAPASMSVKKKDCMDLPPFVETRVHVSMTPDQALAYKKMANEYVAYVRGQEATATIAIVKFLRLQQILAGFLNTDEGETVFFRGPNPRMEALRDLLEDLDGEKVIVWTPWKALYEPLAKLCQTMGRESVAITGEQSQGEKADAEKKFRFGSASVCIANPAAAGTGINLTEASTAIWLARTYKLGDRLQAQARNYRGGSEKLHERVTQIDLVCPGSLDETILDALRDKRNIGEQLISWSREHIRV